MQRVAVLFSGRVKTWEDQRDYLESLKTSDTGLPVDFFCSAGSYRESFDSFVAAMDVKASQYLTYEMDPVYSTYPVLGPGTVAYNLLSALFHLKNTYRLMEEYGAANGIEYVVVIRWRAELICHTHFKVVWPLPSNTIYIPQCDDNGGIHDKIAYGDGVAMKKYVSLYDHIGDYIKITPLQGERHLLCHIKAQGLQTQRYELSTRLHSGRS